MSSAEMNAIKIKDRLTKQKNLLAISEAIKVMKNIDRGISSTLQKHLLDLMMMKGEVTIGEAQRKMSKLNERLNH